MHVSREGDEGAKLREGQKSQELTLVFFASHYIQCQTHTAVTKAKYVFALLRCFAAFA
jgi:hypothetical protein